MRRCAALLVFCVAPVFLAAAEDDGKVANPAYKNWSAFNKGTTVTLLQTVTDKSGDQPGIIDTTARPNHPAETFMTYELVSVTPEKAVVRMTETEADEGSEVEHAPVKITYPAQLDKKHTTRGLGKEAVKHHKEGDEEVEIAGKKVMAHWVENDFKVENEESYQKVWYCDDVPGGLIKRVTTKKEGGKVIFETTVQLVRMKVEK
jgi:hypothetical protein